MNGRHLLVASVISVQNANFVYPSCQNCFSKLLVDSKRYSCLKCGCTGDTEEANYRYRLSLEVADTQGVFEVTIFGSCLDVYFGVTAKDLQRYIEELNKETGEPGQDATQGVVFQAVETCFIGKKFVFAVKGFDRPDGTSSLQSICQTDRYPKAFIACQMFVPDPALTGYTVIHYLQQHQCSHCKHGHAGFWPPDLFAAFDEPSWELSSLQGLGDLNAVPSSPAGGISYFWPQSFGLTCSSISSPIVADPNSSTTIYDKQKWEDNPVSTHGQLTYNSKDHNPIVTERNEEDDTKCHLFSTQWNHVKCESEIYSFLRGEDRRLVQTPLKLAERDSFCKIAMQHSYGLPNSGKSGPHSSLCPLASPSSHARSGENSQEVPDLWDELPSSESLNEFIAKIENNNMSPAKANAGKCFPNSTIDELCEKLTPQPGIFSASFKTRQSEEMLQNLAEKVETCKEPILPYYQSSLLPCHNNSKSHQEAFHSSSSTKGNKEQGCLSNQHPVLLPWCSPAGVKLSHSNGGCSSFKGRVDQDANSFTNHHTGCSLKSTSNCLEDSCLQIKKITAHNKDHDNLANSGGKEGHFYKLNQTTGLTNIQGESFRSASGERSSEICGEKRELLLQAHEYSIKVIQSGLVQDSSDCKEGSYNASADLFDNNSGTEVTGGKLNSSRAFLAQEGSVTRQHIRFEFIPNELEASWSTSGHESSSCNMLTISDQKTSTPVSSLRPRSELSLMDSPDFIPYSQPTPLARPYTLQVSCPRGNEPILTELPLNKLSRLNVRCRRLRPPVENPLVKQLFSKFLKSQRSTTADPIILDRSAPHQSFISSSPFQELPAAAGEDWIPPSEKKWVRPLAFQKRLKRRSLGRNAYCQPTEKPSLSENKISSKTPTSSSRLIRLEFSPKKQPVAEDKGGSLCRHKNDVRDGQLVGVNGLSLSPSSHPMSTIPNWSPELF
nr:DNA damage-induced apoptosis suppressor protein isoform X1 [Pogona vitticeps]XP_020663827.1 DNA damage-induced apoptosis suppressor protein isoform X1 [Pogona vitticeps]